MREKNIENLQDDDVDEKNHGYDHIEGEIDFNTMFEELSEDKLEPLLYSLKTPHHELPGEQEVVEEILEPELEIKLVREKVATDGEGHDIIYWKQAS